MHAFDPARSAPGQPQRPRSPSGAPAPGTSSERLPVTKLGMAPPPRPSAAMAPPRPRRTWLMLVLLLGVASGIAVAIALIGT
jgi:hypothetical protein